MTTRQKILRTFTPLFYGCITGIICGAFIALFLVCARIVTEFALGVYSLDRTPLAVVCTIILVILCCLTMAVLQKLNPSCKGSGIPLAEASARGMLGAKWLRTAATLIAGSILSFLSGMPWGSEGPSIGVGGLIGDGVGRAAKKSAVFRRYLITGGASAGLAVAFNAPLTGVAFALEEAHRRFTPTILVAAFGAVVPAVMVAQLIFWGFGHVPYLNEMGIREGMAILSFLNQAKYNSISSLFIVCGIAAACGVITAATAALFNCCIFALSKVFGKIKSNTFRLFPAFALAAGCGLGLAQSIGSGEATFAGVSISTATWLLFLLLIIRFIITAIASGSGATGGLFLPMIAIGTILGTLIAKTAVLWGLDPAFAPNVIILCISAFFAASVRAPISAIAMSVELTASFSNLLPCALAVGIATALMGLMRISPLYERMMEDLYHATAPKGVDITVKGVIPEHSFICGMRMRDVLWPHNSLVTELNRNGVELVPDGETVLEQGDIITVRAENVRTEYFYEQIKDYITHNRN